MKKIVVVDRFEVSDFSNDWRDKNHDGDYYIKNANLFPLEWSDYYSLHGKRNLIIEMRDQMIGDYCKALGLTTTQSILFFNFIDEVGIDYLRKQGYTVQIPDKVEVKPEKTVMIENKADEKPEKKVMNDKKVGEAPEKVVIIDEFDVSDFSKYSRDQDREGDYYIKNALDLPIDDDDYENLRDRGYLKIEKRMYNVAQYCKVLGIHLFPTNAFLFINFIDEEGIDYLEERGYIVKIIDEEEDEEEDHQ